MKGYKIMISEEIICDNKTPNAQQAVWRHAGCTLAESFAGI